MRIDILTLFPDSMQAMLGESILGRAAKKGVIDIHCTQIRDYTENKHRPKYIVKEYLRHEKSKGRENE